MITSKTCLENGKPKIYIGGMKISLIGIEILFKEEIAKTNARIARLERRFNNNGVGKHEN